MALDLDQLLVKMTASVEKACASQKNASGLLQKDKIPKLVEDLLLESEKNKNNKLKGMSLLALKNSSLLSYINNLALIILSKVELLDHHLEKSDENTKDGEKGVEIEKILNKSIENTVTQRVILERGVKSLEKKLNYQFDKIVNTYKRMEKDSQELDKKPKSIASQSINENDSSDNDGDSDSDDELNFKPDTQSLIKTIKSTSEKENVSTSNLNEKYKPPRISAVAPPTSNKDSLDKPMKSKNKRIQSMDEYLKEYGNAPLLEASIGSTIVNHGRGGVKTNRDREKEREIQDYEENNFVRLPSSKSQRKKSGRESRQKQLNVFGGEDFSIFNNSKSFKSSDFKRKRSDNSSSAWSKAKRRR
ncbi:small subunit rRNA maturation protein LCP5 ASCRUDRAFT_5991 [Ascoidea rubescens DSM 1968]|uniref:Uncharacterized protein n=1 Tax=Ascoidea rubescens DSM 1968 TaxID=1344418 RepID=A0A1D2VRB2_9ASCO|nr:hypothetical protein ASCRUDRAFT_5991 [Ascoidea rubescens DSM 1968]ODV64118.1 hypothetical protein ASCRUDRAFT_5991 [Ascoidea rubescens DSM 1968]